MAGCFWYDEGSMAKKVMNPWKQKLNALKFVLDRIRKVWKRDATPKNLFILAGGIFLLTGIIAVSMAIQRVWNMDVKVQGIGDEAAAVFVPIVNRHPLTGEILPEPLKVLPQVFGIMIENSADAWPLSGLDQAFLVIEAPVEGNIPRFIAFFSEDQDVKKIGPVRSARPYYLEWNAEFNGIYGHVGGSPEALDDIAKQGTLDLNQFFQSEYYYRDERTRYAPHNVYTTMDDLKNATIEIDEKYKDSAAPKYDSWSFTDGVSASSMAGETSILWGNGYDIRWNYDPATNMYHRSQGGNTYTANNIVIIATDIGIIPGDEKGRRTVRTLGEGAVTILKNGTRNSAPWTWKKTSASDRMRFYDETGKEVTMNAGKTWIEVVDDLERVDPPFEGGFGGD